MNRSWRLLVVVAHPDDETFGCGSVIALAREQGAEVIVCCATRGEAGEPPSWLGAESLAELRETELRAAGVMLGVGQFVLLDFADSGMDGVPAAGTLAAASDAAVMDAVHRVIVDTDPDIVVTLDPDHGDGHRDHVVIGRATTAACSTRPETRLFYWALPRPLLSQWFDELAKLRPDGGHLDLDRAGLGRPESDITTLLDTQALRPLREKAIAMHSSQISPYADMPEELLLGFLTTDRLVRVQPPWPGGAPERSLFG